MSRSSSCTTQWESGSKPASKQLLNEFIDLFAKLEQPLSDQEKLKELVGHTPLQVCMGGLLGILTGVLCNLGG